LGNRDVRARAVLGKIARSGEPGSKRKCRKTSLERFAGSACAVGEAGEQIFHHPSVHNLSERRMSCPRDFNAFLGLKIYRLLVTAL